MKKIQIRKLKPNEILKSVKQPYEEALVDFSKIRALDITDLAYNKLKASKK